MKVAFLVMAHHQPAHLARMVRQLADPDFYFFVHVNRRVSLDPFADCADLPRCQFIRDRVDIHWGGWSSQEAWFHLMRAAIDHEVEFERYQLLTGSCFPIKPTSVIKERIAACTGPQILVEEELTPDSRHFRRIAQYHPADWIDLRRLRRFVRLARKVLGPLLSSRVPEFRVFKGVHLWCLPDECMRYVLAFASRHPEIVDFFRLTLIPDESFVHTVLMNSPYGADIDVHPIEDRLAANHYVDWVGSLASPRTLGDEDLARLKQTPALFARKFDVAKSRNLLTRLGDEIGVPATKHSLRSESAKTASVLSTQAVS